MEMDCKQLVWELLLPVQAAASLAPSSFFQKIGTQIKPGSRSPLVKEHLLDETTQDGLIDFKSPNDET